jgi:catechol 2,3-dioxygenase-like lactoylglutathione lyase family enzyme
MRVVGFRHTGISVANMDAALAFYVGLLGLVLISDRESRDAGKAVAAEKASARICVLEVPGSSAHIELVEYRDAGGAPVMGRPVDPGSGHASLWVENVDELFAQLVEANVTVLTPPIDPPSGRRKVYARDPDGFWLELTEAPSPLKAKGERC